MTVHQPQPQGMWPLAPVFVTLTFQGPWRLLLQVSPHSCTLPTSIREISFSRCWSLPRYPAGSYHVPVLASSPVHLRPLCHSCPRARDPPVLRTLRAPAFRALQNYFGLKLWQTWKIVDYSYQVLWVSSLISSKFCLV